MGRDGPAIVPSHFRIDQHAHDEELTLAMVRNATTAIFWFLMLSAAPPLAPAQKPELREPKSVGDPARADSLDQLSRSKYARRQQATLEMWRQREQSRDQVQEAARHPDPEVSGRAKWILRQWRRGSLPDTPPEISRLLLRTDGPVAIERLLEGGQFTAAVVAVEESAGTVDREAIQSRISLALSRRFPIYVHHALAGESLADLLRLIDLVADSKEMAVCRVQVLQQMGVEVGEDSLLPASAVTWSPIERQRATALVLMIQGKFDRAIEVASESVDKDLLHQCRMIASRWSEAARDSERLARDSERGSYEHARLWCLTLIAADRGQEDELFREAVKEFSWVDETEDELAAELRWKCLASHGEVDAAFEILDKVSPDSSASVSVDASRPGRAFGVLGFPLDRVDSDMTQWVDEAITAQADHTTDELTVEVRKILALMQCLIAVGRDDAAWYIASRLSQCDVSIDTLRLREYVLSTLTMTKRSDWVVPLAISEGENTLSPMSQNTISRTLSDADAITFEIVMQALVGILRGASLEQRLRATYQLFEGEVPEGFDSETDFRQLYQYVTGPRPTRRSRGSAIGGGGILANLNIVKLFTLHGESDLAAECLQKLTRTGDLHAMFYLAEQELDGGRAETALSLFQSVLQSR